MTVQRSSFRGAELNRLNGSRSRAGVEDLSAAILWNAPRARSRQKRGPAGGENQDFEAALLVSQSPINTAVRDMSTAVFVNLRDTHNSICPGQLLHPGR